MTNALLAKQEGSNLANLYEELISTQSMKDAATKREASLKKEIQAIHAEEIAASLAAKDEPFGSVVKKDGLYKMSFTTPKKVIWDQGALAKLSEEFGADYIDTKYDIKESAYKNWPKDLQACFVGARTVQDGNISMKIEKDSE